MMADDPLVTMAAFLVKIRTALYYIAIATKP